MQFHILKSSTLPLLRMKLIENSVLDYDKFMSMLENSAITFSMRNKENGVYTIANASAGIVLRTKKVNVNQRDEYYVFYKWKKKDTKKSGVFLGQFSIDFVGQETGNLIFPISEPLEIIIGDSFVKTTITQV